MVTVPNVSIESSVFYVDIGITKTKSKIKLNKHISTIENYVNLEMLDIKEKRLFPSRWQTIFIAGIFRLVQGPCLKIVMVLYRVRIIMNLVFWFGKIIVFVLFFCTSSKFKDKYCTIFYFKN